MAGSLLQHIERIAVRGIKPSIETIKAEHGKAFNTSPRVRIGILFDYGRRVMKTGDNQTKERFVKAWTSKPVNHVLHFYEDLDQKAK